MAQVFLQPAPHDMDRTARDPVDPAGREVGSELPPARRHGRRAERARPCHLDRRVGGAHRESPQVGRRADGARRGGDAAPTAGAAERHQAQAGPVQECVAHPREEHPAEHQLDHFVRLEQVRHVEDVELRHQPPDIGHRRPVDVDRPRLQRRQARGRLVAAATVLASISTAIRPLESDSISASKPAASAESTAPAGSAILMAPNPSDPDGSRPVCASPDTPAPQPTRAASNVTARPIRLPANARPRSRSSESASDSQWPARRRSRALPPQPGSRPATAWFRGRRTGGAIRRPAALRVDR